MIAHLQVHRISIILIYAAPFSKSKNEVHYLAVLFGVDHYISQMKDTEVPNTRRSSACDCTCVLTRNNHCLVTLSQACHAHSVLFLRMQSLLMSF